MHLLRVCSIFWSPQCKKEFMLWTDRKLCIRVMTFFITYFLNILVWMVQESVQLFLCLHWYSLHHLFSKEFPIKRKRKRSETFNTPKAKTKKTLTIQTYLILLCFSFTILQIIAFFTSKARPLPIKRLQLALLWYSLYWGGLELNPQYLWGMPV